jgi:PmbA protein
MLDELLQRAEDATTQALAAGAEGVFATARRSREVEFKHRDGSLEKVQESTSRSITLKVFANGRSSSNTTTDLSRLADFASEAVALTAALQPDPDVQLVSADLLASTLPDIAAVDPAIGALDSDTRTAWAAEMDARMHSDERVVTATATVTDGHDMVAAFSSAGFSGGYEKTWIWTGTETTLKDGDKRPEAWYWCGGTHIATLPTRTEVADGCLEWARGRLGMSKGPTQRTTMVVHPRASGRLFGALLGPMNARSVQQKRSFWSPELSLSDKLTLHDDPLLPGGMGSRPFDGEGLPTRRLALFEGGRANELYVDTTYGRKLGMTPTFTGRGNLVVAPGERDLAAILADVGDCVLITSFMGGNSDGTTGDFSFGIRGHLVAGGVIGQSVGEMNITGNLISMFNQLAEVGNDPWPWGRTLAPTLVFSDMQFSGA